jgi:hypothetical protein
MARDGGKDSPRPEKDQPVKLPTVGYFGGEVAELPRGPEIYRHPIAGYVEPGGLRKQAVRAIDAMTQLGDGEIRDYLGFRYLWLKGYIEPVALSREHPGFQRVICRLTPAGEQLYRQYGPPRGEW